MSRDAARKPSRPDLRANTEPSMRPDRKTNCSELSDRPQAPWISQAPIQEPAAWLAKMVSCNQPRMMSTRVSREGRPMGRLSGRGWEGAAWVMSVRLNDRPWSVSRAVQALHRIYTRPRRGLDHEPFPRGRHLTRGVSAVPHERDVEPRDRPDEHDTGRDRAVQGWHRDSRLSPVSSTGPHRRRVRAGLAAGWSLRVEPKAFQELLPVGRIVRFKSDDHIDLLVAALLQAYE